MRESIEARKSIAEQMTKNLFISWSHGRFKPLGDEANAVMQSLLTPQRQKEIDQAVSALFGAYQSMTFIEAWGPARGLPSVIYRFKACFSNSKERPEIRVVIDGAGRLAGFCIKPWRIKV
ncbi:MAG: hypothetical protein ACE5GK_10115 [Nitrospiria bacterium]